MTTPEAPPQSSLILYQTEDGQTRIQCRLVNDTIWLTQALMAELFVPTISEHLKGIGGDPARGNYSEFPNSSPGGHSHGHARGRRPRDCEGR